MSLVRQLAILQSVQKDSSKNKIQLDFQLAYTCKYQHVTVKYLRSSNIGVFFSKTCPILPFISRRNTVAHVF
jgi:hypothetical protein